MLTAKDCSVPEWLCRRQLFNSFCKAEIFVSIYAVTRGNWDPDPSCVCHAFTFITFCVLWHLLIVDGVKKILFYCCWMRIQSVKIPWLDNLKKKTKTHQIVDEVTQAISAIYSWFGLCCNSCTLVKEHQKKGWIFHLTPQNEWTTRHCRVELQHAKADYAVGFIFLMSQFLNSL